MRESLWYVVLGGVFILPFLPLLVTDSLFFPYITGKNFAFRIIVEIVFAAWILLALLDREYRPKFSWILVGFSGFLLVTFVANIFGEAPARSFWSNFERMEGWVTLIHLFLYFVVAGSVLTTEKLWSRFFDTSLVVAACVSVYAFAQLFGLVTIMQGGVRIDATLGNAIYMAVYMLFHVFIALYQMVRTTDVRLRILYGVLAILFAYLLIQTGTRGTTLGLMGGLFVTGLYIAVFAKGSVLFRKLAIGGIIALIALGGIFYSIRDTAYVREHPILSRLASISLQAGETRFTIWSMALEGVKERPILGWGQGNFDFVFNKYYKPSLYAQEPWFDRVHEIFLDWLVAAGVVGLLAYLFLWLATLFEFFVRAISSEHKGESSSIEHGVVLGLLVGYAIHNIFVFDNLISYFFFATILAFMHVQTARDISWLQSFSIHKTTVTNVTVPIVGVLLFFSVYLVNIPHIATAHDLGRALLLINSAERNTQLTPTQYNGFLRQALDEFKQAVARDPFAMQEIREQIVLNTQNIALSPRASVEVKDAYVVFAESEMKQQIEQQPRVARIHAFFGTFYRAIGQYEKALEQFEIARTLSPKKQRILFDIGTVYLQQEKYDEALAVFREALELAPEYTDARVFYIVAAIYAQDEALVAELSAPPHDRLYITHEFITQAYYRLGKYEKMIEILDENIGIEPNNMDLRVSKALGYYQSGDTPRAIATIREAIKEYPGFADQGGEIIKAFETGAIERQQL